MNDTDSYQIYCELFEIRCALQDIRCLFELSIMAQCGNTEYVMDHLKEYTDVLNPPSQGEE